MKAAFIAFAVCDTLLIIVTAFVGGWVKGDAYFRQHFALGLSTTFFTCLCHCVVLSYFAATGKMIRLVAEDAALDPQLLDLTQRHQRLKMRAYAALLPAIILALLAAFSGAWATLEAQRGMLHFAAAMSSGGIQLAVFIWEFTLIAENGRVLDATFARHEQIKAGERC